MNWKSN